MGKGKALLIEHQRLSEMYDTQSNALNKQVSASNTAVRKFKGAVHAFRHSQENSVAKQQDLHDIKVDADKSLNEALRLKEKRDDIKLDIIRNLNSQIEDSEFKVQKKHLYLSKSKFKARLLIAKRTQNSLVNDNCVQDCQDIEENYNINLTEYNFIRDIVILEENYKDIKNKIQDISQVIIDKIENVKKQISLSRQDRLLDGSAENLTIMSEVSDFMSKTEDDIVSCLDTCSNLFTDLKTKKKELINNVSLQKNFLEEILDQKANSTERKNISDKIDYLVSEIDHINDKRHVKIKDTESLYDLVSYLFYIDFNMISKKEVVYLSNMAESFIDPIFYNISKFYIIIKDEISDRMKDVLQTTLVVLKRFRESFKYSKSTTMKFDPKLILASCFFVSIKFEFNNPPDLKYFAGKFNFDAKALRNAEIHVLENIDYEIRCNDAELFNAGLKLLQVLYE